MLFCVGQHPALAGRFNLREGERLFAYLDDLYILCQPERVGDVHGLLQQHLWNHTRISLRAGKTKVWNRNGVEPNRMCRIATASGTRNTRGHRLAR